ncbi:MAG: hypothetical protein AUJ49_08470 [Desulfovibrionaceae bacterium CG1_02_65_16]|nr:MAG: hypothetical protein AUJ49_08470 [Desulfovibrionaceae bacterium CG1_02_65_16]
MGLIKTSASVSPDLDSAFAAALQTITGDVDAVLYETAMEVGFEARRSSEFQDKTGKLRGKIKLKRSRYENGGWIVTARSPHAHLVEFGHLLVLKNRKTGLVKVVGHVPAHPFMRPALDSARSRLIAKLQAMKGAANG